jgi:DNA primase
MSNRDDIKHIKSTVKVDDVLSRVGALPLRRVATGRVGPCPICGHGNNKSRAFRVSTDGHAWYCFGDCRRGGSVIDLVMALEGGNVAAAMRQLRAGLS